MTDTTLIDHERRLTRLEDNFANALGGLVQRIQRLEEQSEQAKTNTEQEHRKQMQEMMQKLADKDRQLEELKADQVIRELKGN